MVNGKLEDRLKSLKEINKELGKENVENSVNAMNKSINAKNKAVVGEKASIFGLLTDTGGYNRVYNGYADKTLINELKTNNVKYSYANSYFGAGAGSSAALLTTTILPDQFLFKPCSIVTALSIHILKS